jgi:hypothetical protein
MRRLGSRKDTFIYERIRKIERGGLLPRVRALGQADWATATQHCLASYYDVGPDVMNSQIDQEDQNNEGGGATGGVVARRGNIHDSVKCSQLGRGRVRNNLRAIPFASKSAYDFANRHKSMRNFLLSPKILSGL